MRIDARDAPHHDWYVWNVPRCREERMVLWVDDETNQYAQYQNRGAPFWHIVTIQARRIAIYVSRKLVLIDPVEDDPAIGLPEIVQKEVEKTA